MKSFGTVITPYYGDFWPLILKIMTSYLAKTIYLLTKL